MFIPICLLCCLFCSVFHVSFLCLSFCSLPFFSLFPCLYLLHYFHALKHKFLILSLRSVLGALKKCYKNFSKSYSPLAVQSTVTNEGWHTFHLLMGDKAESEAELNDSVGILNRSASTQLNRLGMIKVSLY